jgi:hypothetical protein
VGYLIALQKDAEFFLKRDAPVVFDLTFDIPHNRIGVRRANRKCTGYPEPGKGFDPWC